MPKHPKPKPPKSVIDLLCELSPLGVILLLGACSTPAAKSALDVLLPAAADMLVEVVRSRFGQEVDQANAICFSLDVDDDDGYTYIVCRGKGSE